MRERRSCPVCREVFCDKPLWVGVACAQITGHAWDCSPRHVCLQLNARPVWDWAEYNRCQRGSASVRETPNTPSGSP
jgi:hypothetical protein